MKTGNTLYARLFILAGLVAIWLLTMPVVSAQDAIPLRVEAATAGQLTAASPNVIYTFSAYESTRMGFVFDVQGDMQVTLTVLGSDAATVLASSSGTNNNGLIVTFPGQGTYFVTLQGSGGTSASYRLMIDADPAPPTNAFVMQSYTVRGSSRFCEENTPATFFSTTEDLGVCFSLALVDEPMSLTAQWYAPDGQVVGTEATTVTADDNYVNFLTGLGYDGQTAFSPGWWQVHFLLNGELMHIQWVTVTE